MSAVYFRLLVLAGLLGVLPAISSELSAEKRDLLKKHLVSPTAEGESNYYLDLWEPPKMRVIAPGGGLTNNHALFINSHGKGVKTKGGRRYAFYPHAAVGDGLYFIEDIAALIGPDGVSKIHNIIISACNTDSSFNAKEVRKHFPNATNIIHSAPGEAGYQEMLFQLLLSDSSQIETLYQIRVPACAGDEEFEITNRPVRGSRKLAPYVATLFRPGKSDPYRKQKAGRELLTATPLSDVLVAIPLGE